MSTEYLLPNYTSIEDVMLILQIPCSAAEAHGLLCGIYCSNNDMSFAISTLLSQSDITSDTHIDETAQHTLHQLGVITSQQLTDINFGFQLLLPEDDAALSERSAAIGAWCQGFVSGLGEANIHSKEGFADELQELLLDLTEISKIDHNSVTDENDDEANYIELVEYVRVAVLTIHTDCLMDQDKMICADTSGKIH